MAEITNFRGEATPSQAETLEDRLVAKLIAHVGRRVRKARGIKGITRRVLSRRSGVSMRYLARLEAGDCNISIGLLHRVAAALDCRLEWLLGEEDPWNSEILRLVDLYRSATADARDEALRVLSPHPVDTIKAQRICLIGLRGAGKSSLGKLAGEELGVPFIELNREIEDQNGIDLTEIMDLYGHEGFRVLERRALDGLVSTHDCMILAVAGGIVAEPETYNLLLDNFHSIWIKATPEEHMSRVVEQGDVRPMARNPHAMEQLKSILKSRDAQYSRADAILDTSSKTLQASSEEIVRLIRQQGFLS